jgi:glutamine amidotransferase-like uncharacterized protein
MSKRIRAVVMIAALLLLQMPIVAATRASSDVPTRPPARLDDLAGLYEFDLSANGLGILVVEFSIRDGDLWARIGSKSEPIMFEAVPETSFAFRAAAVDEGTYELHFAADDRGRVNRAHLKNETLGIETSGRRLAAKSRFAALRERLLALPNNAGVRRDLAGVRLAVYFDEGMDQNSALALGRAGQWAGCQVDLVNAKLIKAGELSRFHVLAIPGGERDPDPWHDLGSEGKASIRQFVAAGGGYIGICLGAVYASSSGLFWGAPIHAPDDYLDLFPGTAQCGQPAIAPKGSWPVLTGLLVAAPDHPITRGLPSRFDAVMYPNGPYLQPGDERSITVLTRFAATGRPAMIALQYGEGRVFVSGPHPEIDVTSDRDGSSMFEDLEDEESEWPLLLSALRWAAGR